MRRRAASLLAVLAMVGTAACGSSASGTTATTSTTPATTTTTTSTTSSSTTSTSTATTTTTPTTTTTTSTTTSTTTPPPSGSAVVLVRGNTESNTVALTFDAGSDRGYTADILDTLDANGIIASFGLTGAWVEANPDLVARIAEAGHHIFNHSWSHPDFTTLTTEERWDQLDRTDAAISALTGTTTRPWFRPPFGAYDASVNADLYARGYSYNLYWTVDSLGWKGLSAAEIAERCLSRAEPGAIYLLHVGAASADAIALQDLIDGLVATGYEPGSVLGVL